MLEDSDDSGDEMQTTAAAAAAVAAAAASPARSAVASTVASAGAASGGGTGASAAARHGGRPSQQEVADPNGRIFTGMSFVFLDNMEGLSAKRAGVFTRRVREYGGLVYSAFRQEVRHPARQRSTTSLSRVPAAAVAGSFTTSLSRVPAAAVSDL